MKTDAKTIGVGFAILVALVSALSMLFMVRADAKESRVLAGANEIRIRDIETKYARFEGIMDERTRMLMTDVAEIKRIVSEWEPK